MRRFAWLTLPLALLAAQERKTPVYSPGTVRTAVVLPGGANSYYTGNRPPLLPSPLIKLPLGSVRAGG